MSRTSKLDINTAGRDELMQVAGLRPAAADALLRHRKEAGRITDLEALVGVNGIGESTLERLRSHTKVAAEAPREEKVKAPAAATEPANDAGNGSPQAAARSTKPALELVATATERTADVAEHAAQEMVERVEETAEATDRLIGDMKEASAGSLGGELGSLWLATLNAQVEDGVSTLKGMVAARNVNDMVELQARFVSQSVGRIAAFQSRSLAAIGKATSGFTER